jgi:hypothetical protein
MEENWYAVEQQIRDRLTEARAGARTWTLIHGLAPSARRPYSITITLIPLASWVLARALWLSLKLSRALANARTATKRYQSTNALMGGKESRP